LYRWIIKHPDVQEAVDADMNTTGSDLQKTLKRNRLAIPLPPEQISSLYIYKNSTEREVQFNNTYFSSGLSLSKFREEKIKYLSNMPNVYILRNNSKIWELVNSRKFRDNIENARDVICAKMNLKDTLLSKLSEFESNNLWPTPPISRAVPEDLVNNTVVLLLSIDSGGGTVKLMGRFLYSKSGQSVTDVFLIAQAASTMENFQYFEKLFSGYHDELYDLTTNGINFGDKHLQVKIIHDHDFKVLYILTGNKGARSNFPCPFCRTPRQLLDKPYSELMKYTENLPFRPEVEDLRNMKGTQHQYGGVWNMFLIHTQSKIRHHCNVVPPILHIQLGIMNKLISVFDLVLKEWELRKGWTAEDTSPAKNHLAKSLSKIGVERQKYYCGEITGRSGRRLMQQMEIFCENFFCSDAEDWTAVINVIPDIIRLKTGLIELSRIYNGTEFNIGLGFLLNYQGTWTPYMIGEFKFVSEAFITLLTSTIGRPPKDSVRYKNFPFKDMWRTSLASPKLHALTAHVHEFVQYWNVLGKAKEESFEHTHKESRNIQNTFSRNQCQAMKIIENMRQSWVKSSLHLKAALRQAEERRIAEGNRRRRPRHS